MIAPSGRQPWRALLATSDKAGALMIGTHLHRLGWEVLATKGTQQALHEASVPAVDVESIAGTPELLGGRLKTLTTPVFGALLMRSDEARDTDEAQRWGFAPIHLLLSGFYVVDPPASDPPEGVHWIERIDVGGPAMLRAAAKNNRYVIPLIDPGDYQIVLDALSAAGGDPAGVSPDLRRHLAATAFWQLVRYDESIAGRLATS